MGDGEVGEEGREVRWVAVMVVETLSSNFVFFFPFVSPCRETDAEEGVKLEDCVRFMVDDVCCESRGGCSVYRREGERIRERERERDGVLFKSRTNTLVSSDVKQRKIQSWKQSISTRVLHVYHPP